MGIKKIVKDANIFTIEEEDFDRILNDFSIKLEDLKENDFDYYTVVVDSWIRDINKLLEDVTRDSNLTTPLQRLLEIFES